MTKPTHDACLVEAELRARAAYSQPHRHYHDERHVEECLAELGRVPDLSEPERQLLRWAILWHDSVYEPGHRNNEELSARLALSELSRCGVDDADAQEVARLIRVTEKHRTEHGDRLGALMVSIDLAILGADSERYREYVADVRLEYSHVPDKLWRSGRALVLGRLLDLDPIFPDKEFRARLDQPARRNMKQELKALAED